MNSQANPPTLLRQGLAAYVWSAALGSFYKAEDVLLGEM